MSAADNSKIHILIVEDDPKSRKLLRDVLGAIGYKITETDNAEDGIRLAQESHPTLILMDIRLPKMSGIDALRALRADEKTRAIPVIAVTASVMQSQTDQAVAAGFDAIEQKPVNMQSLLKTIRKFTEHDPQSKTT